MAATMPVVMGMPALAPRSRALSASKSSFSGRAAVSVQPRAVARGACSRPPLARCFHQRREHYTSRGSWVAVPSATGWAHSINRGPSCAAPPPRRLALRLRAAVMGQRTRRER